MNTLCNSVLLALLLSTPLLALGQGLVVVPPGELKARKEAMERAYEDWRAGDKGLERNVFRSQQGKALEQIDAACERARAFQEARSAYDEALLARVRDSISSLSSAQGKSDVETIRGLIGRTLEALGDTEADLEQTVPAFPGADPKQVLKFSEAQAQLRHLWDLRKNLAEQAGALDQAAATEESLEQVRHRLLASFGALLSSFAADALQAESEGSEWIKYYDSLRDLVAKRAKVPPNEAKIMSKKGTP